MDSQTSLKNNPEFSEEKGSFMFGSGMAPGRNPMRALEDIDFESSLSTESGLKFTSELSY
jgi:hypothetical protein